MLYANTVVFFLLYFLPCIVQSDDRSQFIIPADKSHLETWFDATFASTAVAAAPRVIKVEAGGGGDFKTVSDAVKSIPSGNMQRVIISIGAGSYTERVTIPKDKPYVTLYGVGDANNMPVLVYDCTAIKCGGTVYTATLTAEADHFTAVNLKVVNSSPRPGAKEGGQAAAVRVGGDASVFYNCKFYGYQDTVFDFKGRHLFKDCYIEGTVDFIFGSGKSIYLNSEIHVIPGDAMTFITAQARSEPWEATGFVFVHCSVTGSGHTAFLGRSWFPYARVVYAYSDLSDVVEPQGWSNNSNPQTNRTVFFGEFNNTGPGARLKERVSFAKNLSIEEAKHFFSLDFIQASTWLHPPPKL